MDFIYYTDGSTRNNGSKDAVGAYGFIRSDAGAQYEMVKTEKPATNQRMELMAIISACKDAEDKVYGPFDCVKIYSDSAYAINCYKQEWYNSWRRNGWINSKKEPVANRDLWEQLIPFFENFDFDFIKTKGHADDEMNNRIDALVQNASLEANK